MYSCLFCTVVNDCGWEAKGTITIAMEFEAAGRASEVSNGRSGYDKGTSGSLELLRFYSGTFIIFKNFYDFFNLRYSQR